MKKGIGQAMEAGISPKFKPDVIPEEEVSLLHSPRRLRILEYLANRPCATVSNIRDALGFSSASVRWNIDRLGEGLLVEECADRRYSPASTVPYEFTALFVALHSDTGAEIMEALIKRGSMKAGELRRALKRSSSALSYHLKKLSDFGLIHRESEYYSVDVDILDVQTRWSRISGEFVANLMLKGRMQGVRMEMEHGDQSYVIRVFGEEELVMKIYEVPFHDILG